MKQALSRLALALACLLPAAAPARPEEAPPPLSELRKPVSAAAPKAENKAPATPSPVLPARRVAEAARLCRPGAVGYLAVPDAASFARDLEGSPLGKLLDEPAMANLWRNNRFGLRRLFSDLPATAASPAQIAAIAGAADLFPLLVKRAERFSLAFYLDYHGKFSFLLLFDIGLNRLPAFELLGEWETSFYLANPGARAERGDHAGNYLDVWRLGGGADGLAGGEVAVGFAENLALASNNAALAADCLELLNQGESLASSPWGRRLAASMPASGSTDAVGFLRMDAIWSSLDNAPVAQEMTMRWADYLGYGGVGGEALYYGLEFTPGGSRETYLIPVTGETADSSLSELVAERLQPAGVWTTPQAAPNQPVPEFFLAARLAPGHLGQLLTQRGRLFGRSAGGPSFQIPSEARAVFNRDILNLLTGEAGIAFFPALDGDARTGDEWLLVLACSDNPQPLLEKGQNTVERNRASIHSPTADWRKSVSWSVAHPGAFRRLSGNFLLLASSGEIMVAALDQLATASSFAVNRDFAERLAQAEDDHGLLFYLNAPEMLVRTYPNLSQIMRGAYPRSSGLASRPPLAVLRRHVKGVMGVVHPAVPGDMFVRISVQSPAPTFLAMIGGSVLSFPANLRANARKAMEASRANLKLIWLRLQEYASRFGHFPDNLDDLQNSLAADDVPAEELTDLFTAPAALSRLTPEEARRGSFRLVSGVTVSDEPDVPLVYEAEPWSEDFIGMHRNDPTRGPAESGEFAAFRQMIQLDGEVVTMTEKDFRKKVLPRLAEYE
ncbi:MAG: DUF3352 domain-containing protein [Planctomycetota bacterium]|jgi:hypothetical protein|nr:DUF3352 domain-containing protein [Planctomycetota bacterium]